MQARQLLEELMSGAGRDGDMPHGQPAGQPKPERKSISVGEIMAVLPETVERKVIRLMNTMEDDIELAKQFKALLQPHAAALEKIGLIVDYTAYALVYARNASRGQ